MLWSWLNLNIGLSNADPQGSANVFYRYDPHHIGDITIRSGRSFYSVNSDDTYLNQLKISNYILHDNISLSHRIELFNGFYLRTGVTFSNRRSVEGYETTSILNELIEETDPLMFQGYQAFTSDVTLSYTPQQKYITEPTYKKVLGSKYPTFNILYRKGWDGPLSSDIDYDYGELQVTQNAVMGILGSSKYSVKVGRFFNTKDLRYIDFKRFRQSDPFLYQTLPDLFSYLTAH